VAFLQILLQKNKLHVVTVKQLIFDEVSVVVS